MIGSTYIELPSELQHSMKGLINIKNYDNKCFLWCHTRHLNLIDKNPQGITKEDKMKTLIFLFQKKIMTKLRSKI